MAITLFTATGCARCKIVKKFMEERGISHEEQDIKAGGKKRFQQFYRRHHRSLLRGPDGISFPICFSEGRVIQGVGSVLAWIQGGDALAGFVQEDASRDWWVQGIHLSRGDQSAFEELLPVLRFMKKNGLTLVVQTDGRHPDQLKKLIHERLVDRAVLSLLGPQDLYARILEREIDTRQVEETMTLLTGLDEYRVETPIAQIAGENGSRSYLTPEEVGGAAAWLARATGRKTHPYVIKFEDRSDADPMAGKGPSLPAPRLFAYRTRARRYQVKTEIEKA